jgi:hypothetical protein
MPLATLVAPLRSKRGSWKKCNLASSRSWPRHSVDRSQQPDKALRSRKHRAWRTTGRWARTVNRRPDSEAPRRCPDLDQSYSRRFDCDCDDPYSFLTIATWTVAWKAASLRLHTSIEPDINDVGHHWSQIKHTSRVPPGIDETGTKMTCSSAWANGRAAGEQEDRRAARMALLHITTRSRCTARKDRCRRAYGPVLPPTPASLRPSGACRERTLAQRDRFHGRVSRERTCGVT